MLSPEKLNNENLLMNEGICWDYRHSSCCRIIANVAGHHVHRS
jgi:hypothetical protein